MFAQGKLSAGYGPADWPFVLLLIQKKNYDNEQQSSKAFTEPFPCQMKHFGQVNQHGKMAYKRLNKTPSESQRPTTHHVSLPGTCTHATTDVCVYRCTRADASLTKKFSSTRFSHRAAWVSLLVPSSGLSAGFSPPTSEPLQQLPPCQPWPRTSATSPTFSISFWPYTSQHAGSLQLVECMYPNPIYLKTPDPSLIALNMTRRHRFVKPAADTLTRPWLSAGCHVCLLVRGKVPCHHRTSIQQASGCRPWGSYLSGTLLAHAGVKRHCVQSGVSQRNASGCTLCLDCTVLLVKKTL